MPLKNKVLLGSSAVLLLVPIYLWKRFFKIYREDKKKHENDVIFYQRHNCVVMYSPTKGMSGWPPQIGRIKIGLNDSIVCLLEPILYFISTAQESLDIAIMILTCDIIIEKLLEACKRGVKIRILLNFEHADKIAQLVKPLKAEGAVIRCYIDKTKSYSMMHYKYMLKDYASTGGYVFMGSMNMTPTSFLNNFEDIVFTSNKDVARSVHKNFEECWSFVGEDSKNNFNHLMLSQTGLI